MSCEVRTRAVHGIILGVRLSEKSISAPTADKSPHVRPLIPLLEIVLWQPQQIFIRNRSYWSENTTVCINVLNSDKTRAVSHLNLHSLVGNITSHEANQLTHTESATSFIPAPVSRILADNVHIISFWSSSVKATFQLWAEMRCGVWLSLSGSIH